MDRKLFKRSALQISIFILCLFLTASVFHAAYPALADGNENSTEANVDPVHSNDGYSAVLYDNKSGLPTSEANAIVQTEEGFIWIGSYSGLIRYDGTNFQSLSTDAGISSVVSLFVDSSNRLWIGTNDSGAAVMERGQFTKYGRKEGLGSLSVRTICEDAQGNILIGTTAGISYVDKNMDLHKIEGGLIEHEYIRSLRAGKDGIVYGVTVDGGAFTIDELKLTGFYSDKSLHIAGARSILPDDENPGYLYIGDSGNTIYYGSFKGGEFSLSRRFFTGDKLSVNSIEKFNGFMWACTDKGIGYFDDYDFFPINDIPMTTSVENMMADYNHNLWYVSSQQGVMKVVANQFTDIFNKYGISSSVVYTTCVHEDCLYIGTKNNGLVVIQGGKVIKQIPVKYGDDDFDLIGLFSNSRIRSIDVDKNGTVWFSTFGDHGLVGYKNGRIRKIRTAEGLPSDRVRHVFERDDGSLLVSCTGGLAVVEGGTVTRVYGEGDGITNDEILSASEMDNGDIVVGTDGGGIFVIGKTGVKCINVDAGLSSDVVMRVKKDRTRNIMWFVTSNSIGYLTPDYQIKLIKDFPYLNNFDLYQNSKDQMWVLSSNGIYVAKTDDMLSGKPFNFLYYGIYNGLPGISTSNSYSALTEDGYLYIACTTGVTRVNIDHSVDTVDSVKAAVPFVEADGVMIYPKADGSFSVGANVKKLTVYSYVFNYSLINPEVTYKLEGFDNTAVTVLRSNLQPVDYTNLKGGRYYFNMKIVDPHNGQTNEIRVQIFKQKHFYEYMWFNITLAILIVAAVYIILKKYTDRRTEKLIAKNNEQKKLIREVVEAFARVIDMKDKYTRGHSIRVAHYTAILAKEMGCDEDTVEKYYNIGLLHDIGKIGIDDGVLNKPGKLNDDEYATIQSHSALGFDTLKDISIMPDLAIGAGAHHERPDGKGYPKGLKDDEIPEVARIIAVADTFDAMYSNRPYRNRMPFAKVLNIIKEIRGTQLDADVVDAFLRLVDQGMFKAPDDDSWPEKNDEKNDEKKPGNE